MTPVLLDQRSIIKAGISVFLGMTVVFFSGYYIGQQKAVPGAGMGLNKTIALALPSPAHADTAEYEPQLPQTISPGADIDVDSADSTSSGDESGVISQQGNTEAAVAAAIKDTTDTIEQTAIDDSVEKTYQPLQLASMTGTAIVADNGSDKANSEQQKTNLAQVHKEPSASVEETGIVDTAAAENARYTIQVGVFADADNALRRQSELESQQLSSYINGYTNKRDELRFSVSFGYFNNRSSAVTALNHFEKYMSGSGYVARIRHD
ncbi:MAG: SPOR domain-containing protein [Thiotrichales bacterium]|nr:MAG: SPOR domain-containing protein [Thiotrichales bacterium]